MVSQGKEVWLGGLDSNQDSQLQRLMYYRLYDLPAEGTQEPGRGAPEIGPGRTTQLFYFNQEMRERQPSASGTANPGCLFLENQDT